MRNRRIQGLLKFTMVNHLEELRHRAEALVAARRRNIESCGTASADVEILMSDALDTIAREAGLQNWPDCYFEFAAKSMNRKERVERLRIALHFGQDWVVQRLLDADPTLANDNIGLELALYDEVAVKRRLAADPGCAIKPVGLRRPILHLAFSRHIHAAPEKEPQMLALVDALVRSGADVNDSLPIEPGSLHTLSALYGAIGHAGNLPLARWLLENGADPNDDESLYHSTELGNCDGTQLLLQFGARIKGTNALLRAIDFNNHKIVGVLLDHGADVNAGVATHPGGEPPLAVPALHQAARRMADGRMAQMLLNAGANCRQLYCGHSPYAYARIYGNEEVAEAIALFGGALPLDKSETLLAAIADGTALADATLHEHELSGETVNLLTNLIQFPDKLEHARRLVKHGFDHDSCDEMKMTPLHLAGWEGLAKSMDWLLTLGPNLNHINGFGGNLLSTIIHGSENCPHRHSRNHIACARLALQAGVNLNTNMIEFAGAQEMANFLLKWSCDHPEQVVAGGPY